MWCGPAYVPYPAQFLEDPDQTSGDVDLPGQYAVAGPRRVGVVCQDSPSDRMASGQKFAALSPDAKGRAPIM